MISSSIILHALINFNFRIKIVKSILELFSTFNKIFNHFDGILRNKTKIILDKKIDQTDIPSWLFHEII